MRQWSKLLNEERFRPTNKNSKDERSEFQRDYDRIIFCSAFRRLQDKAQVYPLEKYDYVRTRLTHSLEASSLGRSFGTDVAAKLKQLGKINDDFRDGFSNIISTVCLVHDIGNPPFGHCGEKIMQSWFKKWFFDNSSKIHNLTTGQKLDFLEFEGNAQALRILTKLQFLQDENGINLTYATLASLIKYPIASDEAFDIESKNIDRINTKKKSSAKYKKFGYFQSEKERFEKINEETGLNKFRHPLTYLMEAADDISYSAADLEDGHKKKSIDFDLIKDELTSILGEKHSLVEDILKAHKESKASGFPDPEDLTMQKVRIKIQAALMRDCIDTFIANYDKILEGSYTNSLINGNEETKKIFKKLTEDIGVKYIYNDRDVLLLELVGNKVLSGLLDIFVQTVLSDDFKDTRTIFGKYYTLISSNFEYVMKNWTEQSIYNRLQLVTDFICGMTDSYALDLYQKLTGVKL